MATSTKITTFLLLVLLSFLLSTTISNGCPTCTPSKPKPKPITPKPKPCPSPAPVVKPPVVTPPVVKPPVVKPTTCPVDTLKLGVCANLLSVVGVVAGSPPSGSPCCALLKGLVDTEAALCLCTAIKANVLGIIKLDVPVALSVLLSACQKSVPPGYTC
ncbi:hypothetical protein Dimus_010208 [Dionaea muscipula]